MFLIKKAKKWVEIPTFVPMKIQLYQIGKTSFSFVQEGEKIYGDRIRRFTKFEQVTIPNLKKSNKLSEVDIRKKEGEMILQKVSQKDYLVLLDDKGKTYTSLEFAQYIKEKQNYSSKNLVFLIGGAYGFSEAVYQRADAKISLSAMTFSHQIIRVVFLEQLYRAFSILKGGPYHHE